MSSHADRLAALRAQLAEDRLDGFVVPLTDEHMSEYVGSYAQRLAWLTGFEGSAGSAVVLPEEAAIFTDGRYTLQVRQQVDGAHWSYQSVPETSAAQWLTTAFLLTMAVVIPVTGFLLQRFNTRPIIWLARINGVKSGRLCSSIGVGTVTTNVSRSASVLLSSAKCSRLDWAICSPVDSPVRSCPAASSRMRSALMSKPSVSKCLPNSTASGSPT